MTLNSSSCVAKFCWQCGRPAHADAAFCTECGNLLVGPAREAFARVEVGPAIRRSRRHAAPRTRHQRLAPFALATSAIVVLIAVGVLVTRSPSHHVAVLESSASRTKSHSPNALHLSSSPAAPAPAPAIPAPASAAPGPNHAPAASPTPAPAPVAAPAPVSVPPSSTQGSPNAAIDEAYNTAFDL